MNSSIESRCPSPSNLQSAAPAVIVGDPALLLVGAPRIVGEPFHLYRAAGRRRASLCSAS